MSLKSTVQKKLSNYTNIAIWGAGGLADNALKRWVSKDKISYIIDPNTNKQGSTLHGIDIVSPDHINANPPDCIIICSSAYLEIMAKLKNSTYNNAYFYIYEMFIPEGKELGHLQKLKIDIVASRNVNWLQFLLKKPQILVNISYRVTRFLQEKWYLFPLYWISYFFHYNFCTLTGIQLPLELEAGAGLIFAHPGTIVFTGRAKIGNFVTIYHCCTIGTTLTGNSPEVGNFVTIYTGSHVLGGCNIGDYTTIGAMSLLLDLKTEGHCVIAGIPASIKKTYNL
ncbi:MAG: hypothetical protein HOM11_08205 [Methylococcales bacterium]|jgi:serine acetyltransferase|nr:hypothetical protein [Methylococcales bacterium]MBT7445687.1 hypothetical protein [Methylococcales bacterium]